MPLTAVSFDDVYSLPVHVTHPFGLHLRAAATIVRLASRFDECDIQLRTSRRAADAKCLMDVVMLAAESGTEIFIEAFGERAEIALEALVRCFESDFFARA